MEIQNNIEKYEISTSRYNINVEEIKAGGPGGYESAYLTSEGDSAKQSLYGILKQFEGSFLPADNRALRQRNGEVLVDALRYQKQVGIASGFKPSGAFHFGHKLTSSAVSFFQKNGAQVFIPVADLECMLDNKMPKEESEFWAADNLLDWGANGVNLDAAHVYLQSEEFRVSTLAYLAARSSSFDTAADIYSMPKLVGGFPFLFAGITQVGDIILPQHDEFNNYHSFMVSGQDQDGHMKMTIALVSKSFNDNIGLLGAQTTPSGLYIPHIRGFKAKNPGEEPKMSSSYQDGTLYLGSGPGKQSIDKRVRSSIEKIDSAYSDTKNRENVKKCALDLVRYIDCFNRQSSVDFAEVCQSSEYQGLTINMEFAESKNEQEEAQTRIDNYLISVCESKGQDNVKIVRDSLKDALTEHQRKRALIMRYAAARAGSGDINPDEIKAMQPGFWKVPPKSVVDEGKRNKTKWYDIIYKARDKIQP